MTNSDSGLVIRDSRTQNRFFVDNAIIRQYGKQLGPYGVSTYCALCMHSNKESQNSWPSHATLADEIGISVGSVKKALVQLAELGLVAIEPRYASDGSRSSNGYTLLDPPRSCGDQAQSPHTPSHSHHAYPASVSDMASNNPNPNNHQLNNPQEDKPVSPLPFEPSPSEAAPDGAAVAADSPSVKASGSSRKKAAEPEAQASAPRKRGPSQPAAPAMRLLTATEKAICDVCALDAATATNAKWQQVRAAARKLDQAGYRAAQVMEVFGSGGPWYRTWPGIDKGGGLHPPRPDQVQNELPSFVNGAHRGQAEQGDDAIRRYLEKAEAKAAAAAGGD